MILDKEGPIHDVAWSPNSKEFGVVYGFMPAKTTIFNSKAQATHSFALGPRNTIAFSPHGRFVLVAGFGNLAGQVDIYDLTKNFNKVYTIEASNASICEWSPDGSHILFATTSPRLRVDNGIRIFHVGGGLMYNEEMNELYHVCWRPQSTDKHPLPADPLAIVPEPHESAKAYLAKSKPATKPAGAYRPPGARGTTTPLHFKREDEGGAAYVSNGISSSSTAMNGFGKHRRRDVPGAEGVEPLPPGAAPGGGVSLAGTGEGGDELLSKAALKNKKKREAKKAKEASDRAAGLSAGAPGEAGAGNPNRSPERRDRRGHERNRSRGNNFENRSASKPREGSHHRNPSHNRTHSHQRGKPSQHRIITNQDENQRGGAPPTGPAATAAAPAAPAPAAMPDLTVTSPGGGSPQDKKIRSLLKK